MKKIITATLLGGAIAASLSRRRSSPSNHGEFSAARSGGKCRSWWQQYGMPAVVGMGTQICQWEAQGITGASDLADKDHRSDADVDHGGNQTASPGRVPPRLLN